jgi:hypothetical protein
MIRWRAPLSKHQKTIGGLALYAWKNVGIESVKDQGNREDKDEEKLKK